ncbi:MAG: hypothetical protein DMF61_24900 [Blastocatellia bacterium AA13]|nr:MAG: hypothetical protein DMF61_24900 [Blastocatellia bacterium AA13]
MKPGEGMVTDGGRLVWADVEEAAQLAFKVWASRPELRWAKEAWELLGKAGMTQFSTELRRYEVAIRFLVLCDYLSRLLLRCMG